MSRQGTIKRYTLIIEKLERKHFPTFYDLKSMMEEEGFSISSRTLERDIEQIRNEFGVVIKYNKNRNGYFIDKENTINFESFMRFLEIVATAELLIQTIQEGKEALNYISFESVGSFKGVEYLKIFLEAIRTKQVVSFKHFNWHTKQKKEFILEPYLLKQYQSRWYVYGKEKNRRYYLTFGIDRIEEPKLLSDKFSIPRNFDPNESFNAVVGIDFSGGKRETVILSIQYPQANYLKTLPLHDSQTIISDDKKELVISIHVIPNFELIQKILSHVEFIKVISPKSVADEVKERCKEIIKRYDSKKSVKSN